MEGGSLLINMLGLGGDLFTEYPGDDRNSHGGCQSRETRRWLTGKPSGGAKLPAALESTEWLRLAEWHRSAGFSATGKCQLPEWRGWISKERRFWLNCHTRKDSGGVSEEGAPRPQDWGETKGVCWREEGSTQGKQTSCQSFLWEFIVWPYRLNFLSIRPVLRD